MYLFGYLIILLYDLNGAIINGMKISIITDDTQKAAYELAFSHMSLDEQKNYQVMNPKAYALLEGVLQGIHGIGLVAQDSGQVVGYALGGDKTNNLSGVKYAELYEMRVADSYQGTGIGNALVQKFLEWAKETGYQRASVNAHSSSVKNIAFYKKLGFTQQTLTLEQWL